MNNAIQMGQDWFDKLLPDGLPVPSSTIISGPGGSGKPLIGAIILAAWLRSGGSALVFLINSNRTYVEKLLVLNGLNALEFQSRIMYVDFDPQIDSTSQIEHDMIRANILKPDVLREAIETGRMILDSPKEDIILYGSALNILLFSHTWGNKIFEEWKKVLLHEKEFSSVLSVSTSAFREKIEQLEKLADNLIYTRMKESMNMNLQIVRVKGANFTPQEVKVPFTEETLTALKAETENFRKKIIPTVSKT